MRLLLIGYKNHSLRILNLLKEFPSVREIRVYHPDRKKLEASGVDKVSPKVSLTDDLNTSAEAALITSPSATHADYIRRLQERTPYLFCEKPPAATADEVGYLKSLPAAIKKSLYFNFNYRFTELGVYLKEGLSSGKIGRPLNFHFTSTNGIAFKEAFQKDWRAKSRDNLAGIFGNVGIHYIDFCQWLLGRPREMRVEKSSHGAWETPDSASIFMRFADGVTASIFISYATPFKNSGEVLCDDGYLVLDNGRLDVYTPRESFDASGRFTTPPKKEIAKYPSSLEYYNASLQKSVAYFIDVVGKKGSFPAENFDLSLASNALIFEDSRARQ